MRFCPDWSLIIKPNATGAPDLTLTSSYTSNKQLKFRGRLAASPEPSNALRPMVDRNVTVDVSHKNSIPRPKPQDKVHARTPPSTSLFLSDAIVKQRSEPKSPR